MLSHRRHAWVLILCILAIAVLIFFKPSYGWRFDAWLSPPRTAQTDTASLTAQNEALQAQLAELTAVASQLPQNPQDNIRAMVYLGYPFGFRNELLVNVGTANGVVVGKAVTFQGIFIGTVEKVFDTSAVVQTVFDPAFKMPVRIGPKGVDALFIGGAYPKAASIAKNAAIAAGDIITTAGQGIPYGLPVGVVTATSTSADNLFGEASPDFAYDVSDILTVLIMK